MANPLFGTAVDFNWNELLKVTVQNLASAPSSPAEGWIYYDTTLHEFGVYNGTDWVYLAAGGTDTEAVQDVVGAMVVAGNNIDVTYNDGAGTLTIDVEALTSADLSDFATAVDERARDAVGAALVAGNNIDITVNDGADTITIDVEALTSADLSDFAEAVSDQVGTMVTGNTETGIAVTYDDTDNTLDFVVGTLDTLPAPVADLSLNSHKITSLSNPTSAQDAATKAYVDAAAAGIDWKASVRAATTAAGTLASSFENGDAVDGVTIATGDRILIKNQASGSENGIYTVNASGAPTRATDADANAEVTAGLAVFVEEGTVNADTGWLLTNDGAITVGTTALTFTQFTGLGQVTAGAALTKTGSTLDVAVDSTTIEVSSDALRIAATAAGAGLTGGGGSALAVGAGTGITVNANDVAVDTSVVARRYSQLIGNGSSTSIAVTHSLGNQHVISQIFDASTNSMVFCDVVNTSTTVTTFTFATAPASNAYRVVIVG